MKNALILVALSTIIFSGCKNTTKQDTGTETLSEARTKPIVYVANYPLYYFASRIGGDQVELHFPGSALPDPSGWNPPADTVAAMQLADMILLNGASFEGWLMNVSLPDSLLVNTSDSFASRLLPGGETFTHSHGEAGEHAHEGTAFTTWMDLSLSRLQAEAVKNALSGIQPAAAEKFETNYQALDAELRELDRSFKETVSAAPKPYLVFSHPVYQYFRKAYGLEGTSLHWEPDTPMDDDMRHEIEHLKKDHDFKFLVWERQPLPQTVRQLTELGIQSTVIDPMGGMPPSGDFMEGMRQNLMALGKALGAEP